VKYSENILFILGFYYTQVQGVYQIKKWHRTMAKCSLCCVSFVHELYQIKYLPSFIVFVKAPWSTGQIQNRGLSGCGNRLQM